MQRSSSSPRRYGLCNSMHEAPCEDEPGDVVTTSSLYHVDAGLATAAKYVRTSRRRCRLTAIICAVLRGAGRNSPSRGLSRRAMSSGDQCCTGDTGLCNNMQKL
jgi:hypothetical protein